MALPITFLNNSLVKSEIMANFAPYMKKILLFSVALLWCMLTTMAVPAYRGTAQVCQPDGSYVTLRLLGDEWMHFNTTADGYSVVKNDRGNYVYAELKNGSLHPTSRLAHDEAQRTVDEQAFLSGIRKYQAPQMGVASAAMKARVESSVALRRAQNRAAEYDYTKFKGLIVLVQFNDKKFSRPDYKDIITDMVNKEGYTGYDKQKMPGSVRDYFSDNSDGKFKPQFDVAGPYTVDFSQYDCNIEGEKASEVLLAAIDSANVDVDFRNYDGDDDRVVDLVFFVFAGNGANYSGNNDNLWWPHRSQVWDAKSQNHYVYKDGVLIWDYASSTELAGYTSNPKSVYIDGIGTICHEFSHVLGLPDFYDTNYDEDGQSTTIDEWSLMDQGCYLNKGFTPAGYSLYERYAVGFIDEPQTIGAEGSFELKPLHVCQTGFRIDSPEKEEFFLLENRQNGDFKWDAYLPAHGMLAYRVDLSNERIWWYNLVNARAERNYYELLRAGGTEKDAVYDVFPGRGGVRTLHHATEPSSLTTWSGKGAKWGLFDIREQNGVISFEVRNVMALTALALPDSVTVGAGLFVQLKAVPTPDYAEYSLKWSSSDETVATVDDNGMVRGVAEGECVITAVSDKGIEASCVVVVKDVSGKAIAEFKSMDDQSESYLLLKDAEVLFAYQSRVYLRDETGAISFNNMGMTLSPNDRISGLLYGKLSFLNSMPQMVPVADLTDIGNVSVIGGDEVQPHEKHLDELSANDYSDYVLVKGVKLVKDVFCYAVSGDRRVRVYTRFGSKGGSLPTNYDGKYYDVEAIFGTNRLNGQVIDELYLVKTPTETDAPSGIVELRQNDSDADSPIYNLQGQRVSAAAKGLLIRDGRKLLKR